MPEHPFSVIIPAHNEDAVIARCLDRIREHASADHRMEIIVAANGCTDKTADAARAAAPEAVVIEIERGSKTGAINAANKRARYFPRIILDADVECDFTTLSALADALQTPAKMTAAPAIQMDLSRANMFVRAYYRVWMKQPYARAGKGGAGCYALSKVALEKIGEFPPIIADDAWIHSRFAEKEKCFVSHDTAGRPVFTTVHPPCTARDQIKVEARRRLGNREVWAKHPSPYGSQIADGGLRTALRSGASLPDIAIFLSVKLAARAVAQWNELRGTAGQWSRDESSRRI